MARTASALGPIERPSDMDWPPRLIKSLPTYSFASLASQPAFGVLGFKDFWYAPVVQGLGFSILCL